MNLRKQMVDRSEKISLNRQLDLLGLSKGAFYYVAKSESEENLSLMRLMDEHHLDHPTKGVLQMQDFLRDKGYTVNEKRVRRLLRKMAIEAIYPKKNLSRLGKAKYIMPYLLRGLNIERANQVWQIDITYIAMKRGFMYLTAIIDVYSRFVVGWGLSNTLNATSVQDVMDQAIQEYSKPEIINSDQGSQFTCEAWLEKMKEYGVKVSMDGKGRATDNAYIERLWRTVKREYVYLMPANDGWELEQGLDKFFARYNFDRAHQGISRKKPVEVYRDNLKVAA
jgi:putative transposase